MEGQSCEYHFSRHCRVERVPTFRLITAQSMSSRTCGSTVTVPCITYTLHYHAVPWLKHANASARKRGALYRVDRGRSGNAAQGSPAAQCGQHSYLAAVRGGRGGSRRGAGALVLLSPLEQWPVGPAAARVMHQHFAHCAATAARRRSLGSRGAGRGLGWVGSRCMMRTGALTG